MIFNPRNPAHSVSDGVTPSVKPVSKYSGNLSEGKPLVSTQLNLDVQPSVFTTLGPDLLNSTSPRFLLSDYGLTVTQSVTPTTVDNNVPSISQTQSDSLIEDTIKMNLDSEEEECADKDEDDCNENLDMSFFDSSGLDWSDSPTEVSGSGSGHDGNMSSEESDHDDEIQFTFSTFQSREASRSKGFTTDWVSIEMGPKKEGDSEDIEISGEEEEEVSVEDHTLTTSDKETNESNTTASFHMQIEKEKESEAESKPGWTIHKKSDSGAGDFSGSGEHATSDDKVLPKDANGEGESLNSAEENEFEPKSNNKSYIQEDLTSEGVLQQVVTGKSTQTTDSPLLMSSDQNSHQNQSRNSAVSGDKSTHEDQADRDDKRTLDSGEHAGVAGYGGVANESVQDELFDAERSLSPRLRMTGAPTAKQEQTEGK